VETGLGQGYLGTVKRKGRKQTNRTYGYRATSRLYDIRIVKGVQKRYQHDQALKDLVVRVVETWVRLDRHPHIVSG